jgi:type 1 glutamine amidotransferase
MLKYIATCAAVMTLVMPGHAALKKALIVDGQNNHQWKETTPVLKKQLEETKLFTVDIATSPAKGADMSGFKPDFAAYDVVVLNYNGDSWAPAANEAFAKYVRNGGGVVIYHAADNAFPEWKEFNEMIAVGGWGNRKADYGSAIHYRDGKAVVEAPKSNCGHHAQRLPFQVTVRDPKHPITKGLPAAWMHVNDELYDTLCGPAKDFDLLATAHSDPSNKGTDQNEPMLLTVKYGKGRVFHTAMGHDVVAMSCVGFITTFQRGAEWAATGKVTQKIPADFPGPDKMSKRE